MSKVDISFSTDNHSRVYLKPAAIQGSDYINASFINVRLRYAGLDLGFGKEGSDSVMVKSQCTWG